MTYSLADLTRITGMKRRSVQLWAEAGAVKADVGTHRAGTGTHRRFSHEEAVVACFLAAFVNLTNSPIGVVLRVAEAVRHAPLERALGRRFLLVEFDDGRISARLADHLEWPARGAVLAIPTRAALRSMEELNHVPV